MRISINKKPIGGIKMRSNQMKGALDVARGSACAAAITLAGILALGLAAGCTGITDDTIQILNQALKLISAIAGAFFAVRPGGDRGLIKGALVGAAYMLAGLIAVGALIGSGMSWQTMLSEIAVSVAVGAAAGVLTANLPAKKRRAAQN